MRLTICCPSGLRLEFEGELLEFLAFDRFLGELAQLERGLDDLRVSDLRADRSVPEPAAEEPTTPPAAPEREPDPLTRDALELIDGKVLDALRAEGPLGIAVIMDITRLTRSLVERSLARLQKAGIVDEPQPARWTILGAEPEPEPEAEPEVEDGPAPAHSERAGRGPRSLVAERVAAALADLQAHPGPQRPVDVRERCGLPVSCWNEVGRELRSTAGVVVVGKRGRTQTYELTRPAQDTGSDTTDDELQTDSVGKPADTDDPEDTREDIAPDTEPGAQLVDCEECGAEACATPGQCCPACRRSHELLEQRGLAPAVEPGPDTPPARAPLTELEQQIVELVHRHGPVTPIWIADQVLKNRRDVGLMMRDLERRGHLHDTGGGWFEVPIPGQEAQAA